MSGGALLRPERPYESRVELLLDVATLVLQGPSVDDAALPLYCLDPDGRSILATPAEIAAAKCAECQKHSILAARKALDRGHRVELVVSNTGRPDEHMWIRVDGIPDDPSVKAGMPPPPDDMRVGAVIVEIRR